MPASNVASHNEAAQSKQLVPVTGNTLKLAKPASWVEHVKTLDGMEGKTISITCLPVKNQSAERTLDKLSNLVSANDRECGDAKKLRHWWND